MWNEDIRPVPVNMGRLITSAQTGAVLDLSERDVRRLIRQGALDEVRIGRRVYVTRKSALALVGVNDG